MIALHLQWVDVVGKLRDINSAPPHLAPVLPPAAAGGCCCGLVLLLLLCSPRLSPSPSRLDTGRLFTSEVGDYAGQYVKTADKALCDEIKANGRLVSKDSYTHRWVGGGAPSSDVLGLESRGGVDVCASA